jgi:hypothetical protein
MRIYEVTGKTTAYNSTYPKGGFSCSKDSFVGNQTLVFQIKFCGKSPATTPSRQTLGVTFKNHDFQSLTII